MAVDFESFLEPPEECACTGCGCEDYHPCGNYGPWGLRRCTKCYLLYVSPRPTEADTRRIYTVSFFDGTSVFGDRAPGGYVANDAGYLARAQVLVDWVLATTKLSGGAWLDVGCGPGFLLETVQGYGFKAVGIDVSKAAVEWARTRSLEAYATPAERAEELLGDRKFELISLVDTLFHLRNPGRALAMLSQHIPEGGWLFAGPFDLTTRQQIENSDHPDPVGLGVPEHLSFVNQPSMEYLLQSLGFGDLAFVPLPLTPGEAASRMGLAGGLLRLGRQLLRPFPGLRQHAHRAAFKLSNPRAGYVFARKGAHQSHQSP